MKTLALISAQLAVALPASIAAAESPLVPGSLTAGLSYTHPGHDPVADPADAPPPEGDPHDDSETDTDYDDPYAWGNLAGLTARLGLSVQYTNTSAPSNSSFSPRDVEFDAGAGFHCAVGYDFGRVIGYSDGPAIGIRTEAELNFWIVDADNLPTRNSGGFFFFTTPTEPFSESDGSLAGLDLTANLYLDLYANQDFKLYGLVGGGIAYVQLSDDYSNDYDTDEFQDEDYAGVFLWGAGLEYQVQPGLFFYAQYNQRYYSGLSFFEIDVDDLEVSGVQLGVRWAF